MCPGSTTPPVSSLQPLVTSDLLPLILSLPDISCKWNLTIFVLLYWLISLSMMFLRFTYAEHDSFFFKAKSYSVVWMCAPSPLQSLGLVPPSGYCEWLVLHPLSCSHLVKVSTQKWTCWVKPRSRLFLAKTTGTWQFPEGTAATPAAGSLSGCDRGNSDFNFLGNHHTVSHGGSATYRGFYKLLQPSSVQDFTHVFIY